MRILTASFALLTAIGAAACSPPPVAPLPPNSFAFGIFGDGPYYAWEQGRYRRLMLDLRTANPSWFVHVGDLFWRPCSNDKYTKRFNELNALPFPVFYTPGDNEWSDCWSETTGRFDPLDRLAQIRKTFFQDPSHSLGASRLQVETQSSNAQFAEYVENARWARGSISFATVHIVGSDNGAERFKERTARNDAEVASRSAAAVAWMTETFDQAQKAGRKAVVLVIHANPNLERSSDAPQGYGALVDTLQTLATGFPGEVILIHGDSHHQRVDKPLRDKVTGQAVANFTRIETYGSPHIGWVRIVMDTVAGTVVTVEPRRIRPRLFW